MRRAAQKWLRRLKMAFISDDFILIATKMNSVAIERLISSLRIHCRRAYFSVVSEWLEDEKKRVILLGAPITCSNASRNFFCPFYLPINNAATRQFSNTELAKEPTGCSNKFYPRFQSSVRLALKPKVLFKKKTSHICPHQWCSNL